MFYKITSSLEKEKCIEIIKEKTYETFTNDSFVNVYKNLMRIMFNGKKRTIILLGKIKIWLPMACVFYCKVDEVKDVTVIKGRIGINPIGLLFIFVLLIGILNNFINNINMFLLDDIILVLFIYIPYHLQRKLVKNIPQELCELIDGKLEKI